MTSCAAGVEGAWPVASQSGAARASPDEDGRDVAEVRAGRREAFGALVERHQRPIYRLCVRYVGHPEDAWDLTQEVFLRAYRSLGRFRGDSAFRTWLYRIAVNACLNFRGARRPPAEPLPDTLPDRAPRADDQVAAGERARRVRAAVARLPDRQRATLILKVFHDLTHEEVAAILGSSVGTVKANLFHAMGNLKKLVEEEVR